MEKNKAEQVIKILTEALPFIQKFSKKICIVKYGGAAMVEKEISAVNSEWLLARQSEQFVVNRVAVNTTNPDHPKTQLGVGNNETLSRDKDVLLNSLRNFYNQYYLSLINLK